MEGSRHEKAALISVAYLIGALTIFIGSTAQDNNFTSNVTFVPSVPAAQTASIVSALPPEPVTTTTATTYEIPVGSSVSYQQGVLSYAAEGGRKIISFNPEVSGLQSSPEFIKQGTHVGELLFTIAPDDTRVFFCEAKNVAIQQCSPFVYDSSAETIYPVTFNSVTESLTLADAANVRWINNQLSLPGFISVTAEKPWLLLSQN